MSDRNEGLKTEAVGREIGGHLQILETSTRFQTLDRLNQSLLK